MKVYVRLRVCVWGGWHINSHTVNDRLFVFLCLIIWLHVQETLKITLNVNWWNHVWWCFIDREDEIFCDSSNKVLILTGLDIHRYTYACIHAYAGFTPMYYCYYYKCVNQWQWRMHSVRRTNKLDDQCVYSTHTSVKRAQCDMSFWPTGHLTHM